MSNKCIDNDRVSDYYTNVSNSYSNYTKYGVSMTCTKRTRHTAATFVSRAAKIAAVVLLAAGLAACPPEPEADLSFDTITIYNIPATFSVDGQDIEVVTFKVYVNASDYRDPTKPPAAQGFRKIDVRMKQANGTYTVPIPLRKPKINLATLPDGTPNPDYDDSLSPNEDDGPWRGTAELFSVMISPVMTPDLPEYKHNAIWARGGMTFDKSKERLDWENTLDFRTPGFGAEAEALYKNIIVRDEELKP